MERFWKRRRSTEDCQIAQPILLFIRDRSPDHARRDPIGHDTRRDVLQDNRPRSDNSLLANGYSICYCSTTFTKRAEDPHFGVHFRGSSWR